MLPRSLSFSSDGPTPLRLPPARGAGMGPTLRVSHLSQLRVHRCCRLPRFHPAALQACGEHPSLLRRSAHLLNYIARPSSAALTGRPSQPPTHPLAHLLGVGAHTPPPPCMLISHSPMHHDLTYSMCSRSLPETHSTVPKVLLPQERRAAASLA